MDFLTLAKTRYSCRSYSDKTVEDEKLLKIIEDTIVAPAIKGLASDGIPFVGILYPGLMLTKDGPKLLEFNARFGDPETQTYMRLLDTDLLEIINSCVDKNLDKQEIKWRNEFACNIALASGGYPGNYEKGKIISGINIHPGASATPQEGNFALCRYFCYSFFISIFNNERVVQW